MSCSVENVHATNALPFRKLKKTKNKKQKKEVKTPNEQ